MQSPQFELVPPPPPSGAAAVVTVVGLKLTRSSYTELSRQHLVLIFTLFFFSFDYAHLSEGLPLDYFIIAILFNKVYNCCPS